MDVFILKIILIAVMFLASTFFGLLPIKLLQYLRKRAAGIMQHKWPSLVLCLLSCFTGGVFFGTCFLHLMPDVAAGLAKVRRQFDWDVHYPVAEMISCVGFFLVFFVEELVLLCFNGHNSHHHGHGHDHEIFNNDSLDRRHSSDDTHVCVTDCHHNHDHNPNNHNIHINGENKILVKKKMIKNDSGSCTVETCNGIEMVPSGKAEPECCEGPCEGRDEDPPILMEYRPHAHSHGVRSVTLVLALSFHSIIEGIHVFRGLILAYCLAMGVQGNSDAAMKLFLTIIVHKCIVLFSTGVQLARTHAHNLGVVFVGILLLSSMSPLGSILGVVVEQSSLHAKWKDATVMVLEGLSVGTFLYVTFFEVLVHERDNEHNNLLKLTATLIGFAFIGGLSALGHAHDEDDHHHRDRGTNASDAFGNVSSRFLF